MISKNWKSCVIILFVLRIGDTKNNSDIKEWVERTSMIARIQTAVALQAGVMNGEIPMDDAIAELMNFGRVDFSGIAGVKKDKLDALASKLKETELSDQTETTERQILMLNRIRTQAALIGNLTKSSEAFSVADQLLNDTETLTILDNSLTEGANKLKTISDSIGDPRFDIFYFTGWLRKLEEEFVKIENTSKLLKGLQGQLATYIDLKSQIQTLEPLVSMIELKDYRDTMPQAVMLTKLVLEDSQKLQKLAVIAKSASSDCEVVNDLITARARPHKHARKFTIGMRNGVSDLKLLSDDLNDPWVREMFRSEKNIRRMRKGLEPLLFVFPKIEGLDLTLKAISTVEKLRAVNKIARLQTAIGKIPATHQDVSAVVTSFDACFSAAPQNPPPNAYDQIRGLIKDTKSLPDVVQEAQNVLQRIINASIVFENSFSEIRTQLKLMISLRDTILKENKTTEIIEEYLSPEMPKLSLQFANFQKIVGDMSVIRNFFKNISAGHQTVSTFKNDASVKQEFDFYACLQRSNDTAEKVIDTFGVISKVRKLVEEDVEKFKLATTVVSQLSNDISGMKLLPDEMKTKVNTDSKKLNEMKNSATNARIIGNLTIALQNMYEFGQLEPSINVLKSGGAYVMKKIAEVPDEDMQKDTFTRIWKDHDSGVASMEAQFKKVKAMELKVEPAEATSLEEYGGLFKHLQDVGSVSLNVQNELMVVEALVSMSQNSFDTKELLNLKDNMQRFEDLDLDFASSRRAISSAPAAFSALLGLFDIKVTRTEEPFVMPTWVYIVVIICVVVLILLIIGGVLAYYFIYPYFKKTTDNDLEKWVARQAFKTVAAAEKYHERILKQMIEGTRVDSAASLAFLPQSKMRDPKIFCNPATALSVKKDDGKMVPIHSNRFRTRTGTVFIATQAPMDGKEPGKDNTLDDFLDLIVQQDSEFVVQLCEYEEGAAKCPVYTAPKRDEKIEIGRYSLTTVKTDQFLSMQCIQRDVRIVDNLKKYPDRMVTHLQFNAWTDEWFPIMPHTVVGIMQIVNKSKKPIIVHCMTGVGRTVAFIAIEIMTTEVAARCTTTVQKVMNQIRNVRWHGIQNWLQIYYIQITALFKLCREHELEGVSYWDQYIMLRGIYDIRAEKEMEVKMKDPKFVAAKQAEIDKRLALIESIEGDRKAILAAAAAKMRADDEAHKNEKSDRDTWKREPETGPRSD